MILPGETETMFEIDTLGVSSPTAVTIKAERLGFHKTAALSIQPLITSWSLKPTPVPGCKPSTGTLALREAVPAGGVYLDLVSSSPIVDVPSRVFVKAGTQVVKFKAKTTAVSTIQAATLTASYRGGSKSTTLSVRPIGVRRVDMAPNPVLGGQSVAGSVALECPAAPGNITVALSSSRPGIAQPSVPSIVIPVGNVSGTFNVATTPVLASTTASINATANSISKKKKLTVTH
jgi:hypothetical protein